MKFFQSAITLDSLPLLTSTLSLFFESTTLLVLSSLLWWDPVSDAELIKRVRKSLIVSTVVAGFFIAGRLGYLPHQ